MTESDATIGQSRARPRVAPAHMGGGGGVPEADASSSASSLRVVIEAWKRLLAMVRGRAGALAAATRRRADAAHMAWRARTMLTADERAVAQVKKRSVLSEQPASVAELIAYTRAGAWAPGEQHPAVELAGKAYGYVVVVPATAALYGVAWLIQRFWRLAFAAAFVLLFLGSW